jgi:hypothetical protein
MEIKLRAMADCLDHGHHVGTEKCAKDCRVAAEMCRRLQGIEVFYELHRDTGEQRSARIHQSADIAQKYLGKIIGRHLCAWWD